MFWFIKVMIGFLLLILLYHVVTSMSENQDRCEKEDGYYSWINNECKPSLK